MRRHRSYFPLFLILALLFMLVGDRLPAPVGPLGVQAKKNVNAFVIGLFPSWNPKLNPNQRTESQLEQVEKISRRDSEHDPGRDQSREGCECSILLNQVFAAAAWHRHSVLKPLS